jgi:serine phosphatase RsbU (regulator of sigma subunit)/anti-sigma regulatory factor (Ser/Thr protein kinase)
MSRPAEDAPGGTGVATPAGRSEFAAFIADLTEVLHPLTDPDEIQATAARLLGQRLATDRCAYAAAEADEDHFTITGDYTRGDMPHIVGRFAMAQFGADVLRLMRENRAYVVHDVIADPRVTAADMVAYRATQIAAVICVPLHKDGRFVAAMAVHQRTPRVWTADEVDVVRTVVHRCWESAERARAIRGLRESEARFRALFFAIDEGYCLGEIVLDAGDRPVDYRFLEINPRFEAMTGLVDAVGHTAHELMPDLEPHWVETYARVALEGETVRFESGSEAMGRWFDVWAGPVEPRGRFALVFKDVTERRRAELALRESEVAERHARERAELLADLVAGLDATEGVAPRAQRLADLLVPRAGDLAAVWVGGGSGRIVAVAHGDETTRRRLAGLIAAHLDGTPAGTGGAPALVHASAGSAPAADPLAASLAAAGVHSLVSAPLDMGEDATATLLLGMTDASRPPLGEDDLRLAREIADRAGVVLARARLRDEEHRIALRLQRALLPAAVPQRPDVGIAARYEAGDDLLEVGGDWYDAFELPCGRVGLTVGDVVGHGIEAATAMGRLRTALAALAPHADGPGWLLTHLAEFAAGPDGVDFATACFAILEPSTGRLRYASAGHPPMLVVGPDGASEWLDAAGSPPLFGPTGRNRPEAEAMLPPGATLVLYSDGLVERRRERLSTGLARLQTVARAAAGGTPQQMCDRLVTGMTGDRSSEDDLVVLCVRRTAVAVRRFARTFAAASEALAPLRADVRAWLGEGGVAPARQRSLLLALGEATTNAVEHAYHGRPAGTVEVEIEQEGDQVLRVRVRDRGAWREGSQPRDRGKGIGMMSAVCRDLDIAKDGDGTTVTFGIDARGPRP